MVFWCGWNWPKMPVHHGRELEDGKGDNHDGHETWVQSNVKHIATKSTKLFDLYFGAKIFFIFGLLLKKIGIFEKF